MEHLIDRSIGWINRGYGVLKFDGLQLVEGRAGFQTKAAEGCGSFDGTTGAGEGEIGIIEKLKAH